MKKYFSSPSVLLTLLFCGCLSLAAAATLLQDEDFAMNAAAAGKKEIELGQLASQRAHSGAVKGFGRRMVTDHTLAANKLKALATRERISLPQGLDAAGQAAVDQLVSLSGKKFDRAYMEMMVMDHEKAVTDFEAESKTGTNRRLKSFATQTLPTLRRHLQMARATLSGLH